MTSLLEKAISVIAPHNCICCSKENNILCEGCFFDVFDEPYEVCFLCNTPTAHGQVCQSCSPTTKITHVWMAGTYAEKRRQLIKAYKFDRKRAAYKPLATAMLMVLPYLDDVVVVPVPTASRRVRVRGYDHTRLLAQAIGKEKGWPVASSLRRLRSQRQVGATRAQRFRQAAQAYEVIDPGVISGRHILLIDDVTTSGATLQATATLLAEAGAAKIDAVVATKHTLT